MLEIFVIVTAWMNSRDHISTKWRLASTGFQAAGNAQKGINEFASAMDFRTKELMAHCARTLGESFPRTINTALREHDTLWYAFRDDCATVTEWTPLHSEGLYELVMNFDKFLTK